MHPIFRTSRKDSQTGARLSAFAKIAKSNVRGADSPHVMRLVRNRRALDTPGVTPAGRYLMHLRTYRG